MLGNRIASLRKGCGMSQAELAKRIHISASAIGMYEQGRREPSLDMLMALADEFGVTIDYLLSGRPGTVRDVTALHTLLADSFQSQSAAKADAMSKEELVCHLLWALLE